jgi:hypothetical protein
MRASATAFWNSADIAAEIPCVGLTSKYKPGEAQLSMFRAIWLFGEGPQGPTLKGAIQELY